MKFYIRLYGHNSIAIVTPPRPTLKPLPPFYLQNDCIGPSVGRRLHLSDRPQLIDKNFPSSDEVRQKITKCSEGKVCFSCGYELNCSFVLPRSATKSLTPTSCPFHFMLALYSINLIISNLPDNLAMTMFLPETVLLIGPEFLT